MRVLGIETTGERCGVAVVDETGTLAERRYLHRMELVQRLIADVDAVLSETGTPLPELNGVGVGAGPGSFTGVRIGVVTAKTLAAAVGLPAVPVGAAEAIIREQRPEPGERVVAIIRARPGAVYVSAGDTSPRPRLVTVVDLISELLSASPQPVLLCGDGCVREGQAIVAGLTNGGLHARIGTSEAPHPSTVARLALERLLAGERPDPMALAPVYVAPPPVDPRAERFAPT